MTQLRAISVLTLWMLVLPRVVCAQEETEGGIDVIPLSDNSRIEWKLDQDYVLATNGVRVTSGGAVLTANSAMVNRTTGDIIADGQVRILRDDRIWVSEHVRYNFKTRQIEAEQFRFGGAPVFVQGEGLHGELTNQVYTATNAFVTTDDVAQPAAKVRASRITIIPGVRVVAYNAVLYVEGVPVFYFPYYSRNLGPRANNFNFIPGYRSAYGAYLLGGYTWFLNDQLDAVGHVDYRVRRGVGLGPDLNFNFGPWGEGTLRYYYTHDLDPAASTGGASLPSEDRQRVHFTYQANPATNLQVLATVRYQTDTNVLHDFFEGEYRQNPQPSTFLEVNKFWQNFSLDTYVQPRVNNFLETVERLPEVRLTGFRQELGATPLYYESQSSLGYYRRLFPELGSAPVTNNFEAARADSYHQLLLPTTFFGWLNVTPHAGGRLTYYGEGSGPRTTSEDVYRGVLDTGAEVSLKASRLWPDIENRALDVDGLRHIVEPSADYLYVPKPNYQPSQLPQFDYEFPSLRLLPIEFPDYNAIDSIDAQNVVRLGRKNRLQTKREGQVANLVDWNLYTDWRLQTRTNQTRFSDLFSDLVFKPRSWITIESLTRYDVEDGLWRMAFHSVTFQPNDRWSWTVGHFYLRDDTLQPLTGLGEGNNLLTSTMLFRINENWGLRAAHRFEARDGRLEEQAYSIYRDMRNWTAALTFRVLDNRTGPRDFSVAFTFSLKAFPRFGLGTDVARPYSLLGG
jgi:LPS-assembly protein